MQGETRQEKGRNGRWEKVGARVVVLVWWGAGGGARPPVFEKLSSGRAQEKPNAGAIGGCRGAKPGRDGGAVETVWER